jgi:hypothetical protein
MTLRGWSVFDSLIPLFAYLATSSPVLFRFFDGSTEKTSPTFIHSSTALARSQSCLSRSVRAENQLLVDVIEINKASR